MELKALLLYLVALLEALYPAGGVYHAMLTCEERVALAAHFHLEQFLGRAGDNGVTTGADDFGIGIILGMNFGLHD
jgi:hypothetical protein